MPDWPREPDSNYWFERCWDEAIKQIQEYFPGFSFSKRCMDSCIAKVSRICGSQSWPDDIRPPYQEASDQLFQALLEMLACEIPDEPPVRQRKPKAPPQRQPRQITMPNLTGLGCQEACDEANELGVKWCLQYSLQPHLKMACDGAVRAGHFTCVVCCASETAKDIQRCVREFLLSIEDAVLPLP